MTTLQIVALSATAFTLVFLFVAVILLIVVPLHMKKKNADCTQTVPARIVGFREIRLGPSMHGSRPAPSYAFLYEFLWQGQPVQKESSFTSSKRPTVGEARTLFIDPQNPDRFVDPQEQKRAKIIVLIVGIGMLLMALLAALIGAGLIAALLY